MDDRYRDWYRDNSCDICETTTNIPVLLLRLSAKALVNETMQATVEREPGPTMQCAKLYPHLVRQGFDRIDQVIECLRGSENPHIAKLFSDFKELHEASLQDGGPPRDLVLDFVVDTKLLQVQVVPGRSLMGTEGRRYKMTSNPRGFALLINNRVFTDPSANRAGSEHDLSTMNSLLEQLNYKVTVHKDVKSQDLPRILTDFKAKFQSQAVDSCMVCIMSHGTANEILMGDCVSVNYWTDLIYQFDGRNFAVFEKKPKIFIVHACGNFSANAGAASTSAGLPLRPDVSNMLVCASALPGMSVTRDSLKGAWYINCLAQVVMNNAHNTEAKKMLGDMVQEGMTSVKSESNSSTQLPLCIPLGFTKEFYFNPGVKL